MPKRITIEEKFTQFCVTASLPEVQAILRTANAILKARSGPVVKKRKNPERDVPIAKAIAEAQKSQYVPEEIAKMKIRPVGETA